MFAISEQPISTDYRQPRILVVDDDITNRILLENVLERFYAVLSVDSGHAALEVLASESFDTVLLDIMMPGLNGLQTLERIRATPHTASLPVIMVSALADSTDVVKGLKLGANDYITKPIDVNITLARVKTQITLKRLLDEREHSITQLNTAQEIRDRLFRVATHDLKNPLANIRMAEHVLREAVSHNALANQIMDTVMLSVDAMQSVIDDFLDVMVLQSGKMGLKPECVDLGKVVHNTVLQYQLAAERKDITINLNNVDGMIRADYSRMLQVVSNLISNAVKYSPAGSTVSIWTEHLGDRVRLSIADQGPGIPPKERHLMYTEFGKLTPRPTGQENSTGLGLWIVKHLVEIMGGKIDAEFPPDGGSIFWVELPTGVDDEDFLARF